MSAKDIAAEKELDLIIDEVESVLLKPAKKVNVKQKSKKEKINVNKDSFQKAKALHKAEIRKYRKSIFDSHIKVWKTIFAEIGVRHQAKKSIKKHQMLKKQAKMAYKLSQMKG